MTSRPDRAIDDRVMLVASRFEGEPGGGRALLCRLTQNALRETLGDRLSVMEIEKTPLRGWRAMRSALDGRVDGATAARTAEIAAMARAARVGRLFVDGSNLGLVCSDVRRAVPGIRVTTFFHNVEASFFADAFRHRPSLRAAGVVTANYIAERAAVRNSEQRLCLTQRDSAQLERLYGRPATHLCPMAVRDLAGAATASDDRPRRAAYALFVGGAFYANESGMRWFAREVAPRIAIDVVVVGRGFERHREELERAGNVSVIGASEDLATWYRGAAFVIAPIFHGSGMKTKVAEALMFGKRIVGTPAAFVGYEGALPAAGAVCASAEEFAAAVAREAGGPTYHPTLRALYEREYSYPAHRARLAAIVGAALAAS